MITEVKFNDLPFEPEDKQVVYVEKEFDSTLNKFIVNNYEWIKSEFYDNGLNFCYIPLTAKDVLQYHAPSIKEERFNTLLKDLPSLTEYITEGRIEKPSLVYFCKNEDDKIVSYAISIDIKWYKTNKHVFSKLKDYICSVCTESSKKQDDGIRFRDNSNIETVSEPRFAAKETDNSVRYSLSDDTQEPIKTPHDTHFGLSTDNEEFDYESQILLREIRERIETLKSKGINTMFLHTVIDDAQKLSSIHITKDYRIVLQEYNNLEIKMPALNKAVYLLFLKHPEGIRFKELNDYKKELTETYKKLNPIGSIEKQELCINNIVMPFSNGINEKCARIREAFIKEFDDHLARHYYITGKKGEPKRIDIDRSLIVWE